jgi:transposase-like protein
MSRSQPPHPPEFRQQTVELVGAGRNPAELAQAFSITPPHHLPNQSKPGSA